jgi:hypothetical protein
MRTVRNHFMGLRQREKRQPQRLGTIKEEALAEENIDLVAPARVGSLQEVIVQFGALNIGRLRPPAAPLSYRPNF